MPWNKKGVKVASNILAWAKGRCHLLRSRNLEEKVWGGTLRACFRHVKLGCPLDIQVAGQIGHCICRAGLQGNSQGQRLTFGVIVSAWNLWHWVRSPIGNYCWKQEKFQQEKEDPRKEWGGIVNGAEEKSGGHGNMAATFEKCFKEGSEQKLLRG